METDRPVTLEVPFPPSPSEFEQGEATYPSYNSEGDNNVNSEVDFHTSDFTRTSGESQTDFVSPPEVAPSEPPDVPIEFQTHPTHTGSDSEPELGLDSPRNRTSRGIDHLSGSTLAPVSDNPLAFSQQSHNPLDSPEHQMQELIRKGWLNNAETPNLMRDVLKAARDMALEVPKGKRPDKRADAMQAFAKMIQVAGDVMAPKYKPASSKTNNMVVVNALRELKLVT